MKRSERAKQFIPFSALKGLDEELTRAEKVLCQKRELLEDEAEELNRKLTDIEAGSRIEIEYYRMGEYVKKKGTVKRVDDVYRVIEVDDKKIKISQHSFFKSRYLKSKTLTARALYGPICEYFAAAYAITVPDAFIAAVSFYDKDVSIVGAVYYSHMVGRPVAVPVKEDDHAGHRICIWTVKAAVFFEPSQELSTRSKFGRLVVTLI